LKTDYIPELSEVRMVRRAPKGPFLLSEADARYIEACLRDIEAAFSFEAFPGEPISGIPGRALIGRFIHWWRALEPEDARQREAHARLPGAPFASSTRSRHSWRKWRSASGRALPERSPSGRGLLRRQ
jgi:hypothetical protein